MNVFLNPILSRRSFLGLAGASLALTVAEAVVPLPTDAIPVHAAVGHRDGLQELSWVLRDPRFDLRAVFVDGAATSTRAAAELGPQAYDAVRRTGSRARVVTLTHGRAAYPLRSSAALPLLWLGSFPGFVLQSLASETSAERSPLSHLLKACRSLYVGHLPMAEFVAARLGRQPDSLNAPKTYLGFCSAVDPLVDFALEHVRSGALGRLREVSASLRPRDASNALEAKRIYERLAAGPAHTSAVLSLSYLGVSRVQPSVILSGSAGRLQIELYSNRDRLAMLPLKLGRFREHRLGDGEDPVSLPRPL